MQDFRNPPLDYLEAKRVLFERTASLVDRVVFGGVPPAGLSLTVLEALLFGVAKNIDSLEVKGPAVVKTYYDALLHHADFSESALREGLAKKLRVLARLAASQEIFAGR